MTNHRPRPILRPLAALLLLTLVPRVARADCKLAECGFNIGTASAFSVASMHDMEGGRWIVEAAPGYWTLTTGKGGDDPHGYTGAVSVKREFSKAWGAGVIASFAQQSGSSSISKKSDLVKDETFAAAPGGSVSSMQGNIVGLMATHDFHPDPDGYRVPFSFGALYTRRSVKFNHDFTNASAQHEVDSVDFTKDSLGLFLNASLDLLIKKDWRVMPGVFLAKGTTGMFSDSTFDPVYSVTLPTGTKHYTSDLSITDASPVLYTSVLYRPWGMSFDWNMTQLILGKNSTSSSIYSIKLSKKFGA